LPEQGEKQLPTTLVFVDARTRKPIRAPEAFVEALNML
jgi:acyl-CoA thioesterase FadM